jgi:putative oxidoreductase
MNGGNSTRLISGGRVLLGLYFLLPGLAKFGAADQQIELMVHHGLPYTAPLLMIAGVANIGGGLALLANRYVRLTSLGFVLYIVVINFFLHDFWNFEGIEAAHETQNFFKNLGILAGLLVLAGASPSRRLSLKELARSDARTS